MFGNRPAARKPAIHKKNRVRVIESLEARQMFSADGIVDVSQLGSGDQLQAVPELPYADCSGVLSSPSRSYDGYQDVLSEPTCSVTPTSTVNDAAISILAGEPAILDESLRGLNTAFEDYPIYGRQVGRPIFRPTTPIPSGSLGLGAFKLTDVTMEETADGYSVTGMLNAPNVENVKLSGFVSKDFKHYSLKSDPSTLKVGAVELSDAVTTLNEDELTVTGNWSHALVGTVTFTGKVGADGSMSLDAQTPPRSLLGGLVTTDPGRLTLTASGITYSAKANVAKIGTVSFEGVIGGDGHYQIGGFAGFSLAGYTINGAALSLGNESVGIEFTLPIEGLGDVKFSGSYGPNGEWSLSGTYPGPITIGPVVLKDMTLTIDDDFVRANCKGTIADLDEFVEADMTTTFYYDGRIEMVTVTDFLEVGGFRLGRSTVTAGNNNPDREYKVTIDSLVGIPNVFEVIVKGEVDEQGHYVLKGTQTIEIGGVTLSDAEITVEKGKGLEIRRTDEFFGGEVDWRGTIDNNGDYRFTGKGSVKFAGRTFSDAAFTLTKQDGLRFQGESFVLGTGVIFKGEIKANGSYKFEGDARVKIAGFARQDVHFVMEDGLVRVTTTVDLLGTEVGLDGTVDSSGNYKLTFNGGLRLNGFKLADAHVTLANGGLRCNGEVKVLGQTISLSGWAYAPGELHLYGYQDVKFEGLKLSSASFRLDSDGLTFDASFNNFGFKIRVNGEVTSNGRVRFDGSGDFVMGEISVDVDLNPSKDSYKVAFKGTVDLWVMKGSFDGKIVKGRDGWPEPELTGSAKVKGALGKAISKYTGSVDFRVSAKKVSFEHKDRVMKIKGDVTIDGNYLSCKWSVTNRQTGWGISF